MLRSSPLEPLPRKTAEKIGAIHGDLGSVAERSLNIPSSVIDKLYKNGKNVGDKAPSELPNLLADGEVYATVSRKNGQRRVAVVRSTGNAGDKLVAVLELSTSGNSAELVTIHPMQKHTFENRLRKLGALSVGAAAILLLEDDDESE